MAKRFTATELWEEDWFLDMPNEYKLFWFYMLSNCDHAGVYKVNLRSFSSLLEVSVSSNTALTYFNNKKERIRVISEGIWLIEDFFVFQYGTTVNLNNKLHESIEKIYNKHSINIKDIRGLQDLKDRVKDKVKDKDKVVLGINNFPKIKAIEISEGFAIFPDGSKQLLGQSQSMRLNKNDLQPKDIQKGLVS
ncbi:MAG: hypothetical protein ABIP51_22550 [Bacteroidia bacterium]